MRYFNFSIFLIYILSNSMNIVQSSINDDEDRVTSEGMWKSSPEVRTPLSMGNGNSRFDVGGILTAIGLQQGANMLGLVVFPIMFPLMIAAMFIISMFGTAAISGRELYTNASDLDIEHLNFSNKNASLDSDRCVERLGCEIIQRISGNSTSKKMIGLFKIKFVPDSMDKVRTSEQEPLNCSDIKCDFQNFLFKSLNLLSV